MELSVRMQIMLDAALFDGRNITIEAAELWEWQEGVAQLEAENEQYKRAWAGLRDAIRRAPNYDWPKGHIEIGIVLDALEFGEKFKALGDE